MVDEDDFCLIDCNKLRFFLLTQHEFSQAYALDAGAVQDLIAKIDTTKTVISDYCPAYLSNRRCEPERYRNLEGICNNLENPHWGAAMVAHSRFLPSAFADGISAPRISVLGKELPTARLVISITLLSRLVSQTLLFRSPPMFIVMTASMTTP